jgi:hypothetical protein
MAASRKVLCLAVAAMAVCLYQPRAEAAPTLDLTTLGSSGWVNGAYFEQIIVGSTGTGVIDPFVRMGTNAAIEQGYNTAGTLEFDTKASIHTHALLLSSVPTVDIGGTLYREFLLDIGEPGGSKSTLSLDTIEIYVANAGNLTGYPGFGGAATLVWSLDSGGDAWILMDAKLNPGNGWGDMFAYIPNSVFTGGSYVYLYSKFGASEGSAYPNDGSFEEWAVQEVTTPPPPPPVPAPAAFLLVLLGSSTVVSLRRRRIL